jgi:hypothetical protein
MKGARVNQVGTKKAAPGWDGFQYFLLTLDAA